MTQLHTYSPRDDLTVTEAAPLLNLSVRAVQARIKAGTLKARKIGTGRTSPYVIRYSEIQRLIDRQE